MTDNIKLPPMPKPHIPPVFATAANTPSVKAGHELGGYEKTPPLFDEHQLEAYAREAVRLNAQEAPMDARLELWLTSGSGDLHPRTKNLVARFARAVASKLLAAEKKYGYSDGWASPDWMDECRQKMVEHIAKGDPRDVAAYCAFLWHHGESTAAPAAPQPAQPAQQRLKVTDAMAYAFHSAISDGSLGSEEVEEIKRGLVAAFANYEAAQQPLTDEKDALLRQALEALEPLELSTSLAERTAEAIRNHLGVKND